ncbi:Tfp pilus assembly protein PilF [Streptomyces sp. 1222.5]|uniref:tetratricopeptide repeat protein n=1 Tax=unclassified Streptomyces TaxID=2593676 RepID=UPI0008948D51|nr:MULTISPECIES: tetratricopeptide repeat protein [unclassified Streptomyces]PKW08112.1 Tfp pilus assembly protein PilF [Streptomyces sp. 5112.2]SEC71717.1 Tfp pilus assembly protein PilF [Streptomyces sp. 1222.5]
MDNRLSVPGTSLSAEPPPGRRRSSRWLRRVLVTALAGGVVAGAVLTLLPGERQPESGRAGGLPAAGPQAQARTEARARAQALTAVTSGVPAALPQLTSLIGQQEERVRARPRDAKAWAVLGSAYVQRGSRTADAADYPRAEQALRTSLQVRGERNTEALDGMAALALARRDFPAAKRYAEQALKAAPKRWSAYPPLIDAYNGLGDYEAARKSLDKLLGLRTGTAARPAVMARASAVYRDRGWREDAVAQLTDAAAAAQAPAEQAAYLAGLGRLAWERGDLEDALRHFEAALRLDRDQRAAQAGRGRTLAALGRPREAVAAYRAALTGEANPQDVLELGELYESLGQEADADAQYAQLRTRVRRAVAGGVDEDLLIGRFEADHGDPWDAVERLHEEWRRQPGIEVADALGWALHRAGEDQEALTYATIATDKAKGGGVRSAPYAFHLGMIEGELERYGPARRHLQEALRINPHFSPLGAPEARRALAALGDVPEEPLPAEAP